MRHLEPLGVTMLAMLVTGCYETHSRAADGMPEVAPDGGAIDASMVRPDPPAPRCTAEIPGGGRDLARRGSLLYIFRDGSIEVVDLDEPLAPRPVETFIHPALDEPTSAVMSDALAVATYEGSLTSFSVTPSLAARETLAVTGVHP
jgi:hypothetical protein